MILFSAIIFFLAFFLIIILFSLRAWEISRGQKFLPETRNAADRQALHLKALIEAGQKDLEHLPPLLLHAGQRILHGIAVDAGHLALWLGTQSHRLADSVSHKRNFERRETRSEFLKKVAERKSGENSEEGTSNV